MVTVGIDSTLNTYIVTEKLERFEVLHLEVCIWYIFHMSYKIP